MRRVVGILVIAVLLAACSGSAAAPASGGGGGGGGGGEIPPLSVAWFGTAFDPATFAVSGRATGLKQGTPIVAVGRTFTARSPEDVSVAISTGGSVRITLPVAPGASGPTDVFAIDLTGANLTPATYIVSFVDKRGSVLASGNLNVTP